MLGEMKDVLIRFASNPLIYQIIDIVVGDIPDAYGLFLSRDWSRGQNGFFATDWSTLWFPKNGKSNQIKISRERHLRKTVIELHDPNEPVLFYNSKMGNYMYEIDFGNFKFEKFHFFYKRQQSKILNVVHIQHDSLSKNVVDNVDNHDHVHIIEIKVIADNSTWTLYFDGSTSKEGVGASCLLIDLKGNKICIE